MEGEQEALLLIEGQQPTINTESLLYCNHSAKRAESFSTSIYIHIFTASTYRRMFLFESQHSDVSNSTYSNHRQRHRYTLYSKDVYPVSHTHVFRRAWLLKITALISRNSIRTHHHLLSVLTAFLHKTTTLDSHSFETNQPTSGGPFPPQTHSLVITTSITLACVDIVNTLLLHHY